MFGDWSCIVITCPNVSSVISTEKEISILKKKGRISEPLCVLTVEDPAKNVGSGAATLNALLIATEHLSVKKDFMVVSSDVLNEARILILHNGRNYIYSCSGKAFIPLPLEYSPADASHKSYSSGIISNLESALMFVNEISKNCPCGVWVCSTDMMILKGQECIAVNWQNIADVVMFCIPSDVKYATGHGVISVDEQGLISDILYCGSEKQIRSLDQDGEKVPLVSGIVYLTIAVADSLLSLHVQAPLDSCTYMGLDSGADPIQVSLFFDLLVAMSSHISKESFIAGKCGKTYNFKVGIDQSGSKESALARSLVWEELSRYKMSPEILTGCQHLYWSAEGCAKTHMDNLFRIACSEKVHSVCEINSGHNVPRHLIVNSCLKTSKYCEISSKCVIYDSVLDVRSLHVGENSLVCGISVQDVLSDICIPSNLVIIRASVKNPDKQVFTIMFGMNEDLRAVVDISNGSFCNRSWTKHLEYLNISEDDLWCADLSPKQRTLMNARLFIPNLSVINTLEMFQNGNRDSIVIFKKMFETSRWYSMNDILNMIDYSKIFDSRRTIYAQVSSEIIRRVLENNEDIALIPYFYTACAEGWHFTVMDVLDEVLLSDTDSVIKTRTLSNMADLLGAMAGSRGGLRTGPGSNRAWSAGFSLLMKGDIIEGLQTLKKERSNWLDRPDHIMRAARHYERATQLLIQRSVSTVIESIKLSFKELPEVGACVVAECPARIDLQGGWSDTPPICYELGGSVVNIAILVDGKKPIGAKAWRIKEPSIILKLGVGDVSQEIVIKHMKDVLNYDQPNAQGALLKAALICASILDMHSDLALCEQLMTRFGGGFYVQSWSLLPQGCGMGTSSILAGAIVGVLWSVSGKMFDKLAVIHAVLYVEQLLTTGGGWQDQVSGIMGAINRGYSDPSLPLSVKVEAIPVTPDIIEKLNSHLLLIYTGKVRLAKNLLQNVIRNWYAREETVVTCFKKLLLFSHQIKDALIKGDLDEVGRLMDIYWEQKKVLAPGCEPLTVKNMMKLLKPLCCGQILVGAGGGGFMCILTKEPNAKDHVKEVLSNFMGNEKMSFHMVSVDPSGLEIKFL